MALQFHPLHPHFVAEVSPVDLRQAHDAETLDEIRAGMDEHAVLVFRNQPFTDAQQLAFAAAAGRPAPLEDRHGRPGAEPPGERRARRHLEPRRARGHHGGRQPPAGVRAREPALAYRRVVPGSGGPLLDAVREGHPARRGGHGVRGHARRLRRLARGDEGAPGGTARPPLDRVLAPDARLRVLRRGGGPPRGRRPSARPPHPALGPPVALPGLARVPDRRLAAARGAAAPPRSDGARDAAPVRLPASLGGRRPRHLGQPGDDAPGAAVRRHDAPPRAPPRHHARHRAGRAS